jgi:hypothetical protein
MPKLEIDPRPLIFQKIAFSKVNATLYNGVEDNLCKIIPFV